MITKEIPIIPARANSRNTTRLRAAARFSRRHFSRLSSGVIIFSVDRILTLDHFNIFVNNKFVYTVKRLVYGNAMQMPTDIPSEVSRIEGELKAMGLTAAELCRRCGFHQNQWIRWRNGKTEPRIRTWRVVIEAVSEMRASAS